MQLGLKGRTALVTGGSRGIGFGAARVLAAEGCHLHLASRSAEEPRSGQAQDHRGRTRSTSPATRWTCRSSDERAASSRRRAATWTSS